VLLAEDEDGLRQMVSQVLQSLAYIALAAADRTGRVELWNDTARSGGSASPAPLQSDP